MLGVSVQGLPSQCSCSLTIGTRSSDESSVLQALYFVSIIIWLLKFLFMSSK